MGLNDSVTVFQAEVRAIVECTRASLWDDRRCDPVTICSASASVMTALDSWLTSPEKWTAVRKDFMPCWSGTRSPYCECRGIPKLWATRRTAWRTRLALGIGAESWKVDVPDSALKEAFKEWTRRVTAHVWAGTRELRRVFLIQLQLNCKYLPTNFFQKFF